MRIDRMLAIVVILLNRRKITAKELAGRFEVSLRTVYRDINALNLAGIPVISNQGTGGGYELPDNYKFNKQFMSISDLRAILAALKGVHAVLDDDDMAMIFEKVHSLLPEDERQGLTSESDRIIFDTQGWGSQDKTGAKIQQLYEAIKSRHMVRIDYRDSYGRASQREIEPLTLVMKGYAWYIYAYCRKRRDTRLFKLTRLKQLEVVEMTFASKHRSYRKTDTRWEPKEKNIRVVLKFSNRVRHLVEDYLDDAQLLTEDDRWLTVAVQVPDGEWLMGMILSYGPMVEVLDPPNLVRRVRKRVAAMAQIYGK